MHNSRNRISTNRMGAVLLSMLAFAFPGMAQFTADHGPKPKRSKPRRMRQTASGGLVWPANGARECARRIGGQHWRNFLDDDRARRGLPARTRAAEIRREDIEIFGAED